MSEELTSRKIHPRNLTAHADSWQRGNPVTARPESGVDNSFPGLEFDQRNLDKRFFPGLEFEYHFGPTPPILRRIEPERAEKAIALNDADVGRALILYKVFGTFGSPNGGPIEREVALENVNQLSAWRILHDLEPGHVGVFLAPFSQSGPPPLSLAEQDEADAAMRGNTNLIRRDAGGNLRFAVLTGDRADYLVDGVINPALYEPGDLTRSLCAPWQYDFADCGCFYWASNKPDMVAAEPDGDQFYNFQRIRDPATEPPTGAPGSTSAERAQFQTIAGWDQNTMRHRRMIEDWETLPIVLDGTETTAFEPSPDETLPADRVLSRAEVISRLKYLATVEHGLMVEYLFAHYSIDTPREQPVADGVVARRYDAANTVLSVAIDEMRHFRWVNEILRELGEATVIDRVGTFRDLDNDARFLAHDFSLEPLTPERLNWFIDVERPSKEIDPSLADDTIDGLYTRILLSIRQGAAFTDDERAKLIHLIKLIIDEGYDHFSRFQNVQRVLTGLSPDSYLRIGGQPTRLDAGHPAKVAELMADQAYSSVLSTLMLVFAQPSQHTGDLLRVARLAMYALDDAAHEVIRLGGAPLFTLPPFVSGTQNLVLATAARATAGQPANAETFIKERLMDDVEPLLQRMRDTGSAAAAEAMAERYKALRDGLRELL